MGQILVCPQGHQWPAPFGDSSSPAGPRMAFCPVCGTAVEVPSEDSPTQLRSPGGADPSSVPTEKDISPPIPGNLRRPEVPGYEILGLLGRGGMGVVYKARQLSLGRPVALKVLRGGSHADWDDLARFRAEAEMIARLHHPNIVQVFEVGEHDGCPYLSLELLEGGSLAAKLAGTPLAPREAARLAETLARAVHHAHQRGVVHRDLKPANVLLAADGTPKIADFGLAKSLQEDSGRTRTGAVLGTPSYMAPEQAQGKTKIQEIGPAADVYALGAILYEMLTGRPPFRGETPTETLRQVTSDEPVPPALFQPKVPRDLQTICVKCLEKEPSRRYPSAEELAGELQRFLAGRPVLARPSPLWEKGLKWVRRRPAVAALIIVSGLAALTLLAVLLWSYARIRKERDLANLGFQKALDAMGQLTEAEEQLAPEPELERQRRARLDRALAFYTEFLRERGDDPAVRKEIAFAFQRVGDIARLLGRQERACGAYGRALPLLNKLAADFPSDPVFRERLAYCYTFIGESRRLQGRAEEAKRAYEKALEIQRRLVDDFPGRRTYRQELARCHYNLGIVLKDTNHPPEAEQAFREAIGLLQELVKQAPTEPGYRQELARSLLDLGPVLRLERRFSEAESVYRRAVGLLEGLKEKDPGNPDYRFELAVACNNFGNLLGSTGRYGEARAAHHRAGGLLERLTTSYPRRPLYRKELANTRNSLGAVLAFLDQPAAAAAAWERSVVLWRQLVAEFPGGAEYQAGLGRALGNLGWLSLQRQAGLRVPPVGGNRACFLVWLILRRQGLARTRALLVEARGHLELALKSNADDPANRLALRNVSQNLAETYLQAGDHARAAEAFPRPDPDRGEEDYQAARFLARCAAVAGDDWQAARRYANQTLELLRQAGRQGYQPVKGLMADPVFRPLRWRKDFARLAAGWAGKPAGQIH